MDLPLFRQLLVVFSLAPAWASAEGIPLRACHPEGLESAVLCGSVERPLKPDAAEPLIRVQVVVVPARARQKLPDPLYLLAGGPGQSAIDLAPKVLGVFSRINTRRDLVFVDIRGTGQSAPLNCDESKTMSLAESLDPDKQAVRLAACRERLRKLPWGDLRYFTTTLAMHDLEAVRAALGHERINLIGASYGTRAALEYLRLYPQRVRRMVIDGVAPPDMALPKSLAIDGEAALRRYLEGCEREPACAKLAPGLPAQWRKLVDSLPVRATVDHPLTGVRETLTVTQPMLLNLVRAPLYQPDLAAALPAAVAAALEDRWGALLGLASMSAPGRMKLAAGLHYSVVCAEDMRDTSPATPGSGDFAGESEAAYRRICADWPKGAVDPAFYRVATSPAPVLLLSGGLDPVTPPRHGERVARLLGEKARHVVAPNEGHGLLGELCFGSVLRDFLNAKDDEHALAVDVGCLQQAPPPAAFVPLAGTRGVAP